MIPGTHGYGFFRTSVRFRRKMIYWHILPACTELGFWCEGKSVPATLESFEEGIRIQDQIVFAAAAAEAAKGRASAEA